MMIVLHQLMKERRISISISLTAIIHDNIAKYVEEGVKNSN